MHTTTGLDQENNVPDKAKDTQSAGVPGKHGRLSILKNNRY